MNIEPPLTDLEKKLIESDDVDELCHAQFAEYEDAIFSLQHRGWLQCYDTGDDWGWYSLAVPSWARQQLREQKK